MADQRLRELVRELRDRWGQSVILPDVDNDIGLAALRCIVVSDRSEYGGLARDWLQRVGLYSGHCPEAGCGYSVGHAGPHQAQDKAQMPNMTPRELKEDAERRQVAEEALAAVETTSRGRCRPPAS